MKCPKCQTENPETRKFCRECGAKIILLCPQCSSENLPGDKFCGECGHSLSLPSEPALRELSFEEKIDKIQRYLPKGLTEKILTQKDKIEGERKQVTVMFCDMEGFTSLSERLGPEEAYDIVDQIYELLIHKVHDYEGTVNEMTGDGIVALFGSPIALEDAPQRAVRSAMAIHREMSKFSDRLRQERKHIPPLKMRVGIHTGPVVVGTVGNNLRVEFKAVGDTVNLASRMEGLAEPGATYVTEDTFKLTEGFFRFEALGEKEIKGKKEPVSVYRVIAPSARRTRFDVSAERGLTPFLGRKREIELLLDAFERAKAGRGQAVSIMSEAGLGKSRLLYEFRKVVANEDVTFLEGKCLSYSRGVAYHPVIDILKSNFNVQEGEGDSHIRKKVRNGLKVLGADEATTLPYLLELLSIKESGIDKIMMSPEGRKNRIIEALKRIVLMGSEIRPLIMAFEDLHWMDKSSEEVLKYVLESIPGSRILLLFTYRPEFVHTWGAKSYHSQVMLNRLSNPESLAMVTHLLGTESLDANLENLVLEKAEGVPFFIEEFVKSLIDLKIIERHDSKYRIAEDMREVTIPSTIQDMIMARIDSLPEGAKELLQTGSVIEREFTYELIKRVSGLPEQELLSQLSVLKDSELLYERGIYPQSTYIFKHALTRGVVYDSFLTKTKKHLHGKISTAIEELYEKNLSEHYEVLAEHLIESEDYKKAAEYSRLAGKKAENAASFADAIAYGEKRIFCIEKLVQTESVQRKAIDARTTLGLYYNQISYNLEAKEAVGPILDLALRHSYKRRLSQIYMILGTYCYWVEEDIPKAFNHLEKALKISEEVKDKISALLASHWLGFALSHNCEFEKASYYIRIALDINVESKSLWGISAIKSTLGYNACNQGRVNLGYQASSEAVKLAEESGDIFSKAAAYTSHGISCLYKGFLERAKKHLTKAADFSGKMNMFFQDAFAHDWLGEACFQIGEYQKSKDHFKKAIYLKEKGRFPRSWINLSKVRLETAKVMNNEKNVVLESLYALPSGNKIRLYDGWMRRSIGKVLLNIDDQHLPDAEEWIRKAIEADKRNDVKWHLGRDYALYSELLKLKGDRSKAKKNMIQAIEIYKNCSADGWLKKAEKQLASLS